MLRNLPSTKLDWSSRASPISLLAKNIDANVVEKVDASTKLVDDALLTGIFSTQRLQGMFLFWFEVNLSGCSSKAFVISNGLLGCSVLL